MRIFNVIYQNIMNSKKDKMNFIQCGMYRSFYAHLTKMRKIFALGGNASQCATITIRGMLSGFMLSGKLFITF